LELQRGIEMKKPYANSGVDGAGGYEFQKHCALYIFLEQYNDIKDTKYFICLEHHEDFLFVYLNEDEIINKIETFQAKKSSRNWTLTQEFKEILQKILAVGIDLQSDNFPKSDEYTHQLYFLSNHEISLSQTIKKKKIENIINERNERVKFIELHQEIKNQILASEPVHEEIENLIFKYIDFAKTHKSQKQHLIGMFTELFGNKVLDNKASVITLLALFRDVENTLNQGNSVSLMDKSKRVDSEQINEALNIITTKQKAFDEWRNKKNDYSKILQVSIKEHKNFELAFENAFDHFKDLEAVEHQKIFNFVNVIDLLNCYNDEDALTKIVNEFNKKHNTQFNEITTKASLLASYIQVREGTK